MNILRVKKPDGTVADLPFGVGAKGEDGKSAYEYAQDGGYTGTEAEFAEKLAFLMGYSVYGYIDENMNIIVTGDLANGTYVFKYDGADGTYTDIGSLVIGGVVEYSITPILTNCTALSGNNTIITAGGTATLKFNANDGFILPEAISVVGATHTWDATTGTLILSAPTGDVTITITATKSGYTNIIDTVGYTDGKRISASDGVTLKDAPGYTVTGMFTVPAGGVVRTRGVNFTSATYANAMVHRYNASTNAYMTAYNDTTTGIGEGVTITNDGSGNLTITGATAGVTIFRLVGYGDGANLIVTINEEITD